MLRRFLSMILILCMTCSLLPSFAEEIAEYEEDVIEEVFEDDEIEEAAGDVSEEDDDMYSGYTDSGYTTLKRGDRDTDEATAVLLLQQALVKAGYLSDTADGVYGGNTETAVAAFQRNNGLEETGIADAATQDKLFNGKDIVVAEQSMDPASVASRVQKKLTIWGFYSDTIDGKTGEATQKAVRNFKKYLKGYYLVHPTPAPNAAPAADVVTTGYGDGLIADDELLVPEEPDETTGEIDVEVLRFVDGDYEFDVYRQNVSDGETGDEVDRVQHRLHSLHYLAKQDGTLNSATERALLFFQKQNGLTLTGIADEETQRRMFSEEAVPADEYVNAYKVVVNKTEQRVHVYQWNGSDYSKEVKSFICSTGMKGPETETPSGTFSAIGPSGTGEWYYFKKYECYAKWGYHIVGGIMFHSVIYSDHKVLNKTSVKKLGHRASHGCIRLEIESAKWLYENCPAGTTIVITD